MSQNAYENPVNLTFVTKKTMSSSLQVFSNSTTSSLCSKNNTYNEMIITLNKTGSKKEFSNSVVLSRHGNLKNQPWNPQ